MQQEEIISEEMTDQQMLEIIYERQDRVKNAENAIERLKYAMQDISDIRKYFNSMQGVSIKTLQVMYKCSESNSLNKSSTYLPKILLAGNWVSKLGFQYGDMIRIVTMKDLIIITPVIIPNAVDDPPEKEPLHYSIPRRA